MQLQGNARCPLRGCNESGGMLADLSGLDIIGGLAEANGVEGVEVAIKTYNISHTIRCSFSDGKPMYDLIEVTTSVSQHASNAQRGTDDTLFYFQHIV